jgi:uncharacterized protein (UPF0332 family)
MPQTKNQNILIKKRLNKAREALNDAIFLYKNNRIGRTVLNSLYYAVFYSVKALLVKKDFDSSKHSGIMAFFNKEFVKIGLVPKDLGRFYKEIFEIRQMSDYDDLFSIGSHDIPDLIKRTTQFIEYIEKII